MRLSPFLSITSAVIAAGCSDDTCGTGDAPATGIVASATGVMMTYGNLRAGLNNDCPDPQAPPGVTSVTIRPSETDGTSLFTLCIPRVDLLDQGDRTLGTAGSTADVQVIDVSGMVNGCSLKLDSSVPPTGTASGSGVCASGNDSHGFALTLDGGVTLTRTCGTAVDSVPVKLQGRVAVLPI
jgi:hypothetical protein